MRQHKPIVFAAVLCVLSSSMMFSQTERDRQCKAFNSYNRNNFLLKRVDAGLGGYKKKPCSRVWRQVYTFPVRDNFFQLTPIDITVRFKGRVSDFEAAYLFDQYQLKKSSGLRMDDDPCFVVLREKPRNRLPRNHPASMKKGFPSTSCEKSPGARDTARFLENPETDEMLCKENQGKASVVFASDSTGRKTVKKGEGISLRPDTDDNAANVQPSDYERNTSKKAKIYAYRDSDGRLVFTNYSRIRAKGNKHQP